MVFDRRHFWLLLNVYLQTRPQKSAVFAALKTSWPVNVNEGLYIKSTLSGSEITNAANSLAYNIYPKMLSMGKRVLQFLMRRK